MKAIVQTTYGSPDDLVLREVPTPTPGDDEVRCGVERFRPLRRWVLTALGGKRAPPGTRSGGNEEAAPPPPLPLTP